MNPMIRPSKGYGTRTDPQRLLCGRIHRAARARQGSLAGFLLAGAALLAAAWLLAGCGARGGAVLTQDDLTPSSTAQQAILQEAGGGKTYAYTLAGEGGNAGGPEPAVSAQEAANRAGRMMEEVYGIDLTGAVLELKRSQNAYSGLPAGAGEAAAPREVWLARWTGEGPDANNGHFICGLDAATGAWLRVSYTPPTSEWRAMDETPLAACFVPLPNSFSGLRGRWDEAASSYHETAQALIAQAQASLSGSLLTDGAAVLSAGIRFEEKPDGCNFLMIELICEDGSTYILHRTAARTGYDFGGWPLRAYQFWNETLLNP